MISDTQLLFVKSTPVSPPDFFSIQLEILKPLIKQHTFVNKKLLDKLISSAPTEFWFKGALGDQVMGWLFTPPGYSVKEKYPLVILFHGGPEGAWNADFGFRWNPQVYAGYVVVAINFHGSTGYGEKFQKAILHHWGSHPYDDIMLGLDHLIARFPFIDHNRVSGSGASFGGYMANWYFP